METNANILKSNHFFFSFILEENINFRTICLLRFTITNLTAYLKEKEENLSEIKM